MTARGDTDTSARGGPGAPGDARAPDERGDSGAPADRGAPDDPDAPRGRGGSGDRGAPEDPGAPGDPDAPDDPVDVGASAVAPVDDRIDLPCAVVVSAARRVRGRSLFLGWTPDGRPAAATNPVGLTESARRAVFDSRTAGIPPRMIPYAAVVPMSYVVTGPAVDFADVDRRRAEDQVRYTLVDARGERRDVALGERVILGGIADARTPWQSYPQGAVAAAGTAVSAVPMYSVFAPMPGAGADTGLAMLFQPLLPGSSNEAALRSFIRHTVGRLLVLDESQPPRARRGYLEAAGRLAGAPPRGGSVGTLVVLRRTGMVDFEDEWLAGLELAKRRAKGRVIQALRGLGLVEVSDEVLDELIHPRPDYDIDRLDLSRLFDLADAMYAVARRALG